MIDFRATKELWNDGVTLYAKNVIDGKTFAIKATGVELVEVKNGELWPQFLTFGLMENAGQSLFDALWSAGFRPNSGESSVAHVEATKYHLEDMRKLVFKNDEK